MGTVRRPYAATKYGDYFLGQAGTVTDPFGAATVTAFDKDPSSGGYGLPLSLTNAAGETTYYQRTWYPPDASGASHLESLETYQDRPNGDGTTRRVTLSLGTYYGASGGYRLASATKAGGGAAGSTQQGGSGVNSGGSGVNSTQLTNIGQSR